MQFYRKTKTNYTRAKEDGVKQLNDKHTLIFFVNNTDESSCDLLVDCGATTHILNDASKFISNIHLKCIKDVFSDETVFIVDFGLFLHHIGSDSNPGMTLKEPSRLRDRDVLCSCLDQSKENFL